MGVHVSQNRFNRADRMKLGAHGVTLAVTGKSPVGQPLSHMENTVSNEDPSKNQDNSVVETRSNQEGSTKADVPKSSASAFCDSKADSFEPEDVDIGFFPMVCSACACENIYLSPSFSSTMSTESSVDETATETLTTMESTLMRPRKNRCDGHADAAASFSQESLSLLAHSVYNKAARRYGYANGRARRQKKSSSRRIVGKSGKDVVAPQEAGEKSTVSSDNSVVPGWITVEGVSEMKTMPEPQKVEESQPKATKPNGIMRKLRSRIVRGLKNATSCVGVGATVDAVDEEAVEYPRDSGLKRETDPGVETVQGPGISRSVSTRNPLRRVLSVRRNTTMEYTK